MVFPEKSKKEIEKIYNQSTKNVTDTFVGGKKVDKIEPFNNEDVMESFVEFKPTKKTQPKK